jgi:hypothetical protein
VAYFVDDLYVFGESVESADCRSGSSDGEISLSTVTEFILRCYTQREDLMQVNLSTRLSSPNSLFSQRRCRDFWNQIVPHHV